MGKRNYFSNGIKECSACVLKLKLKAFRVVKRQVPNHLASHYCSICRECENTRAKEYQRLHYKYKKSGFAEILNRGIDQPFTL